jgi:hypothetical protein
VAAGLDERGLGCWPERLPLGVEAVRGGDGAVEGRLAAGGDEDLDRLEQPGGAQLAEPGLELLVAAELVEGFGLPRLAEGRALALDDDERDAVDKENDIGADVLLGALDAELAGDDELVLSGVVEVEEAGGVALLAVAEVLFEGDAVGQRRVDLLAGL